MNTGAHTLLRCLERHGVRHLFGVPGHGAYPIYDALHDVPAIEPIVGRDEQGATFAAVGYAWASGDVAVATSVPAAGLANAATPLLEATWSQDRVLFLLEEDPVHAGIAASVARHHEIVRRHEDIGPVVRDLFTRLRTGRPGAAVLEIAGAVLAEPGPSEAAGPAELAAPAPPAGLERATALLSGARRPMICAGATALAADAAGSVALLAERLQAPVFTDPFSKGLLPETHPLALGDGWTPGGPGDELLCTADAVLVIGSPVAVAQNTGDWNPRMLHFARGEQLVLVDWDDEVQGALPGDTRLHGHVPGILAALAAAVEPRTAPAVEPERLDQVRAVAARYAEERIPDVVGPMRELREALPEDAVLLGDSLIGMWLERLHPVGGPRLMRFPMGTGTLGWGIPAAVGVKLAAPEREVVTIGGDGATLYNAQELATLRRHGLKVTVVVANDDCFSAIKHNMTTLFGRAIAYELANPDFARLGTAFGLAGVRLSEPGQLGAALASALAGEDTTVIELPLETLPGTALYVGELADAAAGA